MKARGNERHLVSLDAFVETLQLPPEKRISVRTGFDGHLETQLSYITDEYGRNAMSFVGRFEQFEERMKTIARQVGYHIEDIPKINGTAPRVHGNRAQYSTYVREPSRLSIMKTL